MSHQLVEILDDEDNDVLVMETSTSAPSLALPHTNNYNNSGTLTQGHQLPLREKIVTASSERQNNEPTEEDVIVQEEEEHADNVCLICQEEWTTEEGPHRVVSLSCGHVFGEKCIVAWLSTKSQCPVCKRVARIENIRPIFIESSANKLAIAKVEKIKERAKQDISANLRQERKKRRMVETRLVEMGRKISNYLNSLASTGIESSTDFNSDDVQIMNFILREREFLFVSLDKQRPVTTHCNDFMLKN